MSELKRKAGETPESIREASRVLVLKILENYAKKADIDLNSLTVQDNRFILDCYKVAIEEKIEARMLNLSDLTYEDLEAFWKESMTGES